MQLAENSVPKMNAAGRREYGEEGGLIFCPIDEAVREFSQRHPAAKMLFLSDGGAYPALSRLEKAPRVISLVLDGEDCLPVFSMPDGVSCVFAAGAKRTLWAARYFAEIRGIACALVPSSPDCDGLFEERGELLIGGVRAEARLKDGEAYCDPSLFTGGAAAYARALLSRLALTEARALRAFRIDVGNACAEEEAYALLSSFGEEKTLRELAGINAKLRRLERKGAYRGEGLALARLLKEDGAFLPEWQAYLQLSALYTAFFKRGKPRRYLVPEYASRAAEDVAFHIPTPQEYAFRAFALEKFRAKFVTELTALQRKKAGFARAVCALSGRMCGAGKWGTLQKLPLTGGGLSAVIYDFGLLEEL